MNRKSIINLPPFHRRQFLRWVGGFCAAGMFPKELEDLAHFLFGGGDLIAQTSQTPKFFVEINLRDQWDFGHVFVAPSLATNSSMPRGNANTAALY